MLGPDSPNQDVYLQWPNGEPVFVTLRVFDAKPSYVPGSIDPGTGAGYQISVWGSNPRTITFSHPDHADDIVVQWTYDPDYVVESAPDVSYVLGPDSPDQDVYLQWPDSEPVFVTLRVFDAKPSYVPGSIDAGAGASYQIDPWGSNPRAITFSHPDHADPIVVQWTYDPDHVQDYADLVIESLSASDSTPNAGESFTQSATVRNDGDRSSAATTLYYYASTELPLDNTIDNEVGVDAVEALAASATSTETLTLTAQPVAGTYYFRACMDPVAEESNTENNCSALLMVNVLDPPRSQGYPDLVVESASLSDSTPEPAEYVRFEASVRNQGDGPAAETTFRYYIVYGDEDEISWDSTKFLLTERLMPTLGPSETITIPTGVAAPITPNRYYHYGACVDAVPGESDTENNCSALLKVTVEPAEPGQPIYAPDLVVESPSVSNTTPYVREPFEVDMTVRNQGKNPSGMVTMYLLRFHGETVSIEDSSIGLSGFLAQMSRRIYSAFLLTAPASAGTYHYFFCVEMKPHPDVIELDTSNNCSSGVEVTVQPAPHDAPDLVIDTPSLPNRTPNEYGKYTVSRGETFTISTTVRNQGTGASAATTLRYYLGYSFQTQPYFLALMGQTTGDNVAVSGLSASASDPVSVQMDTPRLQAWDSPTEDITYWYYACVDVVSEEFIATNNCSSSRVAVTVTPQ